MVWLQVWNNGPGRRMSYPQPKVSSFAYIHQPLEWWLTTKGSSEVCLLLLSALLKLPFTVLHHTAVAYITERL